MPQQEMHVSKLFQKMFCARSALARSAVGAAAQRREAPLGAAQRREAPPQAAERRAGHKACFSAFNFAPLIEKLKMLSEKSVGNCPILRLRQSLGTKLHG